MRTGLLSVFIGILILIALRIFLGWFVQQNPLELFAYLFYIAGAVAGVIALGHVSYWTAEWIIERTSK